MFTGIIEKIGRICDIQVFGDLKRIGIAVDEVFDHVSAGDSIAVNGVCLTLTGSHGNKLFFDVVAQTRKITNIDRLKINDKCNLERSLRANGYISGHFVYGHIDVVRNILAVIHGKGKTSVDIELRQDDRGYVVSKGSVAVDGISLTVGYVLTDRIRIFLIPRTFQNTTLGWVKKGDSVNIEFDMIGKYVKKAFGKKQDIVSWDMLKKTGFF